MSFSPINILQRMKELKTWQENHEGLLKKSSANTTTVSDYQTIEGLSAFDTTVDWEAAPISPTKPFHELLELKLKEDPGPPRHTPTMAKRPFLRKGTGLERFKMSNRPLPRRKTRRSTNEGTPLRAPDVSVQAKGAWGPIHNNPKTPEISEQSLYEKALEKELLIYEALEQRADNSSFCSTNSSVLNLLDNNTPQKIVPGKSETIIEEKRVHWDSHVSSADEEDLTIKSNLGKVDIAEILLRLRNLNQFSDEETEASSYATSSVCSEDLETTLHCDKKDVSVGTEGNHECMCCNNELETKIRIYEQQIDEVMNDKGMIEEIKKRLEQQKSALERDFNKRRQELEEKNAKLGEELDSERKKLMKERQVFQNHVKDSQSRPSKKEREEISNLKQEVAELKETLKMKESKNGMTQARLRNQIKQLEKDNAHFRDEIDKLNKDKAKLSANQKILRRPSADSKILNEINKNISKLTKETLKSQANEREKENDSFLEMENRGYGDTYRAELRQNVTMNDSKKSDKCERILDDGSKEIKYHNGNVKTITSDGNLIVMKYYNGDLKHTQLMDGVIKYFFADKNIWQTTHSDGSETVEFPDGIIEKRHKNGKCEVFLPDGVIQTIFSNNKQEIKYPDGSLLRISPEEKVLLLPNGQKEIETKDHKRREYPDGTVKTLYSDGMQETRFSNGRIRVRDPNGALVVDTHS